MSSAAVAAGAAAKPLTYRQQLAVNEWDKLFRDCRGRFEEVDEGVRLAQALNSTHRIAGAAMADLLLRPQPVLGPYEPLMHDVRLLHGLYEAGLVNLSAVVSTVLRYSSIHKHVGADPAIPLPGPTPVVRYAHSWQFDEVSLYFLSTKASDPKAIRYGGESAHVVDALAEWMQLFTAAWAVFASTGPPATMEQKNLRVEMDMSRVALLALVVMVFDHPNVLRTLAQLGAAALRRRLSDALSGFIPDVNNGSTAHMGERLRRFHQHTLASFDAAVEPQTQHRLEKAPDPLNRPTWHVQLPLPDLAIPNSRAGLYIYLNAALVGLPIIDDGALLSYLRNRFPGDVQTAFISLVLASFDVLANAVFRNEGQESAHVLRSYLVNKVPILLSHLAPSLYATGASPELCITQAMADVDTNAFPTLSSMFDDSRRGNPFTDSVREDFLFACCLHGLVPLGRIEAILGESTYQTLPAAGKYTPEGLIQECLADPDRAHRLPNDLDYMDGNVGPACLALSELMERMCANKETMSLKTLCNQLVCRPVRLDVWLLFSKSPAILSPLCDLLDGFKYDEDIGEYQPVYEEFGSVLSLVFAFVHRYDLAVADLGIALPDQSFVAGLVRQGFLGRPLEELSKQENEHVDRWIHGLFDTEAGGITDELISSCPPQDFYRLVPTIFNQVVLGVAVGSINDESLKTGVDYLAETFLRPSLVTAIQFLMERLRIDREPEQKAILKILLLIHSSKPAPGESTTLLASVLSIVAADVDFGLREHQRTRIHNGGDVQPVLRALKDSKMTPSRRNGAADAKEVEPWASAAGGGLGAVVRQTVQAFVKWSIDPSINAMPTSYTHRQFLAARQMLGAHHVLTVLLDEIKANANTDMAGFFYDVAASIICSADVLCGGLPGGPPGTTISRPDARMNLRDVLWYEVMAGRHVLEMDPLGAEVLVRLHRRVESQLVPASEPVGTMLDAEVTALALGMDVVGVSDDLTDAMAVAAAAAAGVGGGLDGASGLDLDISASVGGGMVDLGAGGGGTGDGADVFAGLGSLGDWNDLDLS